jgi:hypothetical protein
MVNPQDKKIKWKGIIIKLYSWYDSLLDEYFYSIPLQSFKGGWIMNAFLKTFKFLFISHFHTEHVTVKK